jgi:hypothetical protein
MAGLFGMKFIVEAVVELETLHLLQKLHIPGAHLACFPQPTLPEGL